MNAKLVIVGGDAKSTSVSLKRLPATIGRAREATITLPHTLVSRQHCEIFEKDNQLFVKDLKSLNGTYVNNQKISDSTPLLDGQLLTLGNVTFRAVYDAIEQLEIPLAAAEQSTGELRDDETIDVAAKAKPTAAKAKPTANPMANGARIAASGTSPQTENQESDTDHGPLERIQRAKPAVQKPKQRKPVAAEPVVAAARAAKIPAKPNFLIDDESNADKSICLGAMDKLPESQPHASFAGNLALAPEDQSAASAISEVNIEVDENEQDQAASQSSLNEFFRKMPK